MTGSDVREARCGATADLVGDLIEEVQVKLKPLIPPQGSPVTIGASPRRVQAKNLVARFTHTLDGVRS